jgi:hypothetical protein
MIALCHREQPKFSIIVSLSTVFHEVPPTVIGTKGLRKPFGILHLRLTGWGGSHNLALSRTYVVTLNDRSITGQPMTMASVDPCVTDEQGGADEGSDPAHFTPGFGQVAKSIVIGPSR